jgi:glycosyltransferase involved in cell wall biosynthesis
MSQEEERRVSIVIPVYNNAATLNELISRLIVSISSFRDIEFEILIINDGSSDNSLDLMLELSRKNTDIASFKIIDLEGNFGQLGALFAGYENASGDAVISMSADLQDPPEVVSQFLQKWLNNFDLVIGVRAERSDSLLWRLSSKIAYQIITSKHKKMPRGGFDYYLMSRNILNYILEMHGRYRFLPTDLLQIDPSTSYVNYHRPARVHGKSGYSLYDRMQVFLTAMIDTSYKWIQLFSLVGVIFSTCGVILMSTVIYGYLNNDVPFQGFTLIICLILISSGLQFIILSLIGEYVWRTYDIARNKPLYLIRSQRCFQSKN